MAIVAYTDTNLPDVDEIQSTWCFGLPFFDSLGNPIASTAIQKLIDGARRRVERHLGIFLKPTLIASNPDERGLVQDVDYEVAEPPYDYDAKAYSAMGFMQLRERPVQKITYLTLVLPNGQIIVDFLTRPEWVKLYPKEGQFQIVPYQGDPTVFNLLGGSQLGFGFMTGQLNRSVPQMWYIDYIAGYAKNRIPEDIRNIVAKIVAVDVLGIIGEAYRAGVASMSTSLDGLSESTSYTVSSSSTLYSAHIKQYQTEIDDFFDERKSGSRSSERGLTFTVL